MTTKNFRHKPQEHNNDNTTMTDPKALVLSLNAGSSSLKASVLEGEECIVSFLAERLTTPDAAIHIHPQDQPQVLVEKRDDDETMDHAAALSIIIGYLKDNDMLTNLVAVGHRVVHGGSLFSNSAIVTEESLEQMKSVSHLAPL
jgi:acetate kinase